MHVYMIHIHDILDVCIIIINPCMQVSDVRRCRYVCGIVEVFKWGGGGGGGGWGYAAPGNK